MSSTSNDNNAASPASDRTSLPKLIATILTFAVSAGCGSVPFDDPSGGIPPTAELALSPSGQQLLVSWNEKPNRAQAKLLTLSGKTVTSMRDVPLPANTFSTAWGRTEHHVLVTTFNNEGSSLLRIDLQGDKQTVLHKSESMMRLPLEVGEDSYVFLEANKPGDRFSRWRRLQGGSKSLLSDEIYSMGAPLDHVQGSLFILEPRNPAIFRVFQGQLPTGLTKLIDASTWVIRCADNAPLTCLRTHVHFAPDGSTFETMELFNGTRRCAIGERWLNLRQIRVSRDGSTVAFHAATTTSVHGPRAIYLVKNDIACSPEQINIKGKE